jgi:hypothetical protein
MDGFWPPTYTLAEDQGHAVGEPFVTVVTPGDPLLDHQELLAISHFQLCYKK